MIEAIRRKWKRLKILELSKTSWIKVTTSEKEVDIKFNIQNITQIEVVRGLKIWEAPFVLVTIVKKRATLYINKY